jgi:curved DNA-binding protein CbpA
MKYFKDCLTVAEVKKLYKELAMKNHPDLGGDTATMQEINRQYEITLKSLDGEVTTDSEGKEHKYYWNEETEQELMVKINELLTLQMVNVDVFLVGSWLWINGETKQYKEQLKAIGCLWHTKRQSWYFATEGSRILSRYRKNSGKGINDLAQTYGADKLNNRRNTSKKKEIAG